MQVKVTIPELKKKGVVCEVPCSECNHVYISEMVRSLEKWLNELRAAVKRCDQKWNSSECMEDWTPSEVGGCSSGGSRWQCYHEKL